MNRPLCLAVFLGVIVFASASSDGDPGDGKVALGEKAAIQAGQEIEVSIGEVKSYREIQVSHEGSGYTLTLSGVSPASSEDALNERLKTLLAGKERRFFLRVDRIDGAAIRGQLYAYAHRERDEARKKEIIEAVKNGETCVGMRWGGMNLNLLLIQTKIAKFEKATAADTEPLFQELAGQASR